MRNTVSLSRITPEKHSGIRTTPRRPPTLPHDDHRQIMQHLKRPDVVNRPFLEHILRHKISATAQDCDEMSDDIVTGSSYITYSVDGGSAQTGLLHHRARGGSDQGVIPVCSSLGAALIGMRAGQRAPLLREDGTIASLRVLKVTRLA